MRFGLIAIALLAAVPVALATPLLARADTVHQLDIPAEDLEAALKALAVSANEQILFSHDLVVGLRSRGLKGRYTTRAAISILLEGSGLRADRSHSGVLLIRSTSSTKASRRSDTDGRKSGTSDARDGPDTPSRLAQAEEPAAPPETSVPRTQTGVAAAAASVEPVQLKEVIVTGSHLTAPEFTAATPMQTVTLDQAMNAGITGTAGIIALTPAAAGTQQINNQLNGSAAGGQVTVGGYNANSISLRNLGAQRTLVLLDGERLTPSGTGAEIGPVDLNTIPSSIIDHVQILTDGASSIYGSDAVAGVVNIITKKNSNGLEFNAQTYDPQHPGGGYEQASIYWGKTLGRGWINVAAEYDQQDPLRNYQRSYTACAQDFLFNPTTGQREDALNTSGHYYCDNLNPTGVFFDADGYFGGWFNYDPTLSGGPYPAAALNTRSDLPDWVRTARAGYPDTYPYASFSSPAYENAESVSPNKRISLYSSGAYDFTDNIEAYGNLLLNQRTSHSTGWMFLYPVLSATNPNNTVAAGMAAASGGADAGDVQPQMNMPWYSDQKVRYAQALAGLRGTFDLGSVVRNGSWDVSAQYGRSYGIHGQNFFYNDRVQAASGPGVACNPALITVSGPTTCVSIPWLDPAFLVNQDWTPAERAFLEGYEDGHTTFAESALNALVRGSVLKLPAGDVDAALGATVRYDDLNDTPGPNAQAGNYFAFSSSEITKGTDTVREAFAELGIPLLADLPGVHRLSLDSSGRFTDYRTGGSGETYKLGLNWEVVPSVALRGTYGTSFRAPDLYELYLANQSSFDTYYDPCVRWGENSSSLVQSRCSALGIPADFTTLNGSYEELQGGGAGRLKAETSTNLTYGIVFRPSFTHLLVSLDYYAINVRNEISVFGADNIINACYTLAQGYQLFCDDITRDPVTHAITLINDQYVNISESKSRGVDFSANWNVELPFGVFGINSAANYTFTNVLINGPQSPPIDFNGLAGNPKSNGLVQASLVHHAWTLYYTLNYIGPTNSAPFYGQTGNIFQFGGAYAGLTTYGDRDNLLTAAELLHTPSYVTHTVSAKWQFYEHAWLQFGVRNLLDKQPPQEGDIYGGINNYEYLNGSVPGNLYDLIGRTFFANVDVKF